MKPIFFASYLAVAVSQFHRFPADEAAPRAVWAALLWASVYWICKWVRHMWRNGR